MALYSWFSKINNEPPEKKQQVKNRSIDNSVHSSVNDNTLTNHYMWPIAKVRQDRRTIEAIYTGLNRRSYKSNTMTKKIPVKA